MKNIVTIGWGNGHSHLLRTLKESDFFSDLEISALVSMSDDGRTTGMLMQKFEAQFWKHLPPPGDLRRCLYVLSDSPYARQFQNIFEHVLEETGKISDYSILDLFALCWAQDAFLEHIRSKNSYFLEFRLDIHGPITGHKLWNILMASLYKNFLYDYNYMLRFMHDLLDVPAHVIAITTDKAYIEAVLENGEVIEKQDTISNIADYNARIQSLRLMKDSYGAKHNFKIDTAILNAEYIVIAPWDLYTSTISNLLIGGINSLLRKSNAKIVYICNTTNKGGETQDYLVRDFTDKLESYLWKKIDILIVNNTQADLSSHQEEAFRSDISVKGGSYIYVSDTEKHYYDWAWTRLIESDLLGEKSFYKHDAEKLWKLLKTVLI